jgi:hypothetical protein
MDIHGPKGLPIWKPQRLMNFRANVGLESSKVLAHNSNRAYLLIVNTSPTEDIYVAFGRGATLADGLPIWADGGFFEPILGTISEIYAICAVADSPLIIVEGTYI